MLPEQLPDPVSLGEIPPAPFRDQNLGPAPGPDLGALGVGRRNLGRGGQDAKDGSIQIRKLGGG